MAELEIGAVARLTGLKPHTLRYYESIGLIRDIRRDAAGKRIYTEADLKWLEVVNRLRATGMPISKMAEYARLRQLGDSTAVARKQILQEHLGAIEHEIETLMEVRNYVAGKIVIYNEMEAKSDGTGEQVGAGFEETGRGGRSGR